MNLIVNGQHKQEPGCRSVRDLVERLGLAGKAVAVEVNQRLVPRKEYGQAELRDGDVVEVVTLVGGG